MDKDLLSKPWPFGDLPFRQARALLAKHVLRSVQMVIQARKFLEGAAKMIPPAEEK